MSRKVPCYSKRFKSLTIRLPLLFVFSCMFIMVIVISILYIRFKNRMIDEYTRMAEGVTNLMVHAMDVSEIDDYISKNYELTEYNEILEYFYDLRDNYLMCYTCMFIALRRTGDM